jgi:hypothetical protein
MVFIFKTVYTLRNALLVYTVFFLEKTLLFNFRSDVFYQSYFLGQGISCNVRDNERKGVG